MSFLADAAAEVLARSAAHDLHTVPAVGCRACVPEARAVALREVLELCGHPSTVDDWRGGDSTYDGRTLAAMFELATSRNLIPPAAVPYEVPSIPPAGAEVWCGIEGDHEPHEVVRVYSCRATLGR